MQTDAFDNPADHEASYLNIAARVNHKRVGVSVAYELMSGSPEDGAFAPLLPPFTSSTVGRISF